VGRVLGADDEENTGINGADWAMANTQPARPRIEQTVNRGNIEEKFLS